MTKEVDLRNKVIETRRNLSLKNRMQPLKRSMKQKAEKIKNAKDRKTRKQLKVERNRTSLRLAEIDGRTTTDMTAEKLKERLETLNEKLKNLRSKK